MQQKYTVGAVSYLNTKPLIYGFEQGLMADRVNLVIDYPSRIGKKLLTKQIDIGLVPVAVIPEMAESHLISDYCIGARGEVFSVCLFSDVPLEEIKTILLDYQSRTSVELLKILLRDHWNISPSFIAASEGYEKQIGGTIAGLIIGDRAIEMHAHAAYVYDLGTGWKEMTGLPFVFAAWVSNRKVDENFIIDFNNANAWGLARLPELIVGLAAPHVDLQTYYTKQISYELDPSKKEGLELFLKMISSNAV